MRKVGREKWGDGSGVIKVEREKWGREKWGEKNGGEKSGAMKEKWG